MDLGTRDGAADGVTRRDVRTNFARVFHQAADRTPAIHFSLDGIDDVAEAARLGKRGTSFQQFGRTISNVTNWELNEILSSSKLREKTRFYRTKNGALEEVFPD